MILYAVSKFFPRKTFVLTVKAHYKIARVKAMLMHTLYEMGKESHQFRLRYNEHILNDSLTLDECKIMDNAVVKMVPLAKEVDEDVQSMSEDGSVHGVLHDLNAALQDEVKILNRRQAMTVNYNAMLYIHFAGALCAAITLHWYCCFYLLLGYILASYFAPQYSRLSGFTGNYSITPKAYCIVFAVTLFIISGTSVAVSVYQWIIIWSHGCVDWVFEDDCSYHSWYTAIFFGIHAFVYLITVFLLLAMISNYRFNTGDYVERVLLQTRDLGKLLSTAKTNKVKERRYAAFELSSMVASDDNKFLILAEPGAWNTLISLTLCGDAATQECAAETLAELLTIQSIQNDFVERGYIKHLTALLSSPNQKIIKEAMMAIWFIAKEGEQNKQNIIADRGLEDLTRSAYNSNIESQRMLADIFLELTLNKDIRDELASMNTPAQALITLCTTGDQDTQKAALQSLELIALESSDTILAQSGLVQTLLNIPYQTAESKILTLTAKLLLYFADCADYKETLLYEPATKDALTRLARVSHTLIQKILVKIISCLAEQPALRIQALNIQLDQILEDIKSTAADREAWTMADTVLEMMRSTEDLAHLPTLTAEDKISIMREGGASSLRASRTSIHSRGSRSSRG